MHAGSNIGIVRKFNILCFDLQHFTFILLLKAFNASISVIYMIRIIGAATRENRSSGFPTRSDTNRSVQSQKQATCLKFWL